MRGVVAEMAALGMACTVSTLGDDPASADVCVCSSASAARGPLALFTTFVSLESPLRCLDCCPCRSTACPRWRAAISTS